nr:type I polyketide synthase [Kineosporia sp. NBRC 101677]
MSQPEQQSSVPLAVVGMACRYPGGVRSPEDLWQVAVSGQEVISGLPGDRGWDLDSLAETSYLDRGGFLDDVAGFDPAFFGISPREALAMDPQQRVLMEVAWEALERAGLDPVALRGSRTGVFVGAEPREYGPSLYNAPEAIEAHLLTGTTTSVMSGRIAYTLGLNGPALTVDTSASSSLVAIHLAAQALRQSDTSLAIAGGVSVMATPGNFVAFSRLRGLAPDGRVKAFSADADGTVWSEGAGLLVLERLEDAVRNGHRVLAVLRGTAINNDGASTALTAPNGTAQEAVIRDALAAAALSAADIDAVEAHGTGTPLGDRTEARTLLATYGAARPADRPVHVGSVKSNIGHTQAAAGVAGVIKTVMALRHGMLPASLNISDPTPHVDWAASGLNLLTQPQDWPQTGRPRRAGVSSFGISGTNAHAILEEAPTQSATPSQIENVGGPGLFAGAPAPAAWLLSARSEAALAGQAARLSEHLATAVALEPASVAWSLATTRTAHEHRAVLITSRPDASVTTDPAATAAVDTVEAVGATSTSSGSGNPDSANLPGAADLLADLAAGRPSPAIVAGTAHSATDPRVVFVFPGQGSQWLGMGRELAQSSPIFAARLTEAERALAPHLDWDGAALDDVLAGADNAPSLERVDVVQPALFAVTVALAALWQESGVAPAAVVGHSQGEIAAAHVAGLLTLEDAARIVARRSRVLRALAGRGGMLSIAESAEAVAARIEPFAGQVAIGVINSPDATVVSGDPEALARIAAGCERDEVRHRLLPVDYASHSPQVDDVRPELLEELRGVQSLGGGTTMVSSVTAEPVELLDAAYWVENLRQPVRFADAVARLESDGYEIFVEISPHPVLTGPITSTIEHARAGRAALRPAPVVTSTLRREDGGAERFLTSLAEAHVRGVPVDWARVLPAAAPVDLPTYAFEHQRFWLDPANRGADVPTVQAFETATVGGIRERITGRAAGEQAQLVLELIQAHAAALLGLATPDAIDPGRTFKDSGFDSLAGVELRSRLNTATGLTLPTTLVFDYPTPAVLAGFLRAQLLGATELAQSRPVSTVAAAIDEPVAIVAMSCRLPGGVRDPEGLWQLVSQGVDAIGEAPADRGWELEGQAAQRGGYLPDVADFDAAFFGVSPREALAMDPQQRLMLETAWEALERAGIDIPGLRGSATGVYIGAASSGYGDDGPADLQGHLRTGSATSVLSGRVAYTFGFEGPAVTVDTACSSSLVALHLAASALRSGECDLALAGGVTVHATPSWLTWFTRQQGLSSDGRCKAFGAGADGMGMAEGAGVIVLERLSDARRLGHDVLAVVAGSAVNQDGASNGLTAPNGPSQQRVIRAALAGAGLDAADVDAVEAHGTGTGLGDPIEAQALIATYGSARDAGHPLLLGTIKSNIGHTQWAAGAAGIIKTVLALQHAELPRTLHADEPTTHVDWSAGTVKLLTEAAAWPDRGRPRRAGVSSFGISGTNAHVILEQAPDPVATTVAEAPDEARPVTAGSGAPAAGVEQVSAGAPNGRAADPAVPLIISARTADALPAQAHQLAEFLANRPAVTPADLAWSLASVRTGLPERAVVTGATRDELISGLRAVEPSGTITQGAGLLGFVFTGQGAQRVGMAQQLYAAFPVFAAAFDQACAALDEHLAQPESLKSVLDGHAGPIDDTMWAQTGLFAVEVALFRLLASFGVEPQALAGHSIGELAAAHVAGIWNLDDAAKVVAARGRLMQALPRGGAMLSVRAGEADVLAAIADIPGVGLAAVNAAEAVVVSGTEDAVASLERALSATDVRTRRLRVSHAFHSALMEPMLQEFAAVTASVSYAPPRIPIVSTLTGALASEELLDPLYWVRQVREAVRFADAVTAMERIGVRTFVEIGPDAVLTSLGAVHGAGVWIPAQRRDRDQSVAVVAAIGALGARGVEVDWAAVLPGAQRVALPTYAFTRQRFWLSPRTGARPKDSGLGASGHPLLGTVVELPANGGLVLTGRLSRNVPPWLADHVVAGRVVVPGAALVEMAIRAGDETGCSRLAEMVIQAPMVVPARGGIQVQITVGEPDERGERPLAIHSRPEDESAPWTEHATGVLAQAENAQTETAQTETGRIETAQTETAQAETAMAVWPPAGAVAQDIGGLYERLAGLGLPYGPSFQGVRAAWRRDTELFVEVALGAGTEVEGYGLHPALLDSALHLIAGEETAHLPFAWNDVVVQATGASMARVRIAPVADGFGLTLADEQGATIATVGSLTLRPLPAGGLAEDPLLAEALHRLTWVPVPDRAEPTDEQAVRFAVLGADRSAAPSDAPSFVDVAAVVAAVADGAPAPDALIFRVAESPQQADVPARAHALTASVLKTLQDFLKAEELAATRLLVLTERAVDAGAVAVSPAVAGVVGLVRVAQSEQPGRVVLADLDDAPPADLLAQVMACGEAQIAARGGRLLAPRLARVETGLAVPAGEPSWRLNVTERGTLENVALKPTDTDGRPLAPREVRVALRAAGVNFRDVLNVLGMYPGDPGLLGLEGAGVVLETGPEVTSVAAGDAVMGLFEAAFAPIAIADERLLAPVPDGWTMAEAASAPVVYLTAWHALVSVAGLQAGESVLIHAAAGGVGSAAVQVARHLGAEVFGTASPGKWPMLHAAGLDPDHVASSRTLEFEDAFGRVDVVLDSLAGDFVDASLRLAAGPQGRFVEIGKTDVRDPDEVARAHDGLAYSAFDLLELDPGAIAPMFQALSALFADGSLRPLPVAAWDVRQAVEAFRYLSQARNVGKVVLTLPSLRRSGTVLISGVSGALGGLVARHLVASGNAARQYVLLSRRGPAAPGTAALVADLAARGVNVQLLAADVADRSQLASVLGALPAAAPLRTVVHAAGVLDDGVIAALTPERLQAVLQPKVDGAWNLHALTRGADLDHFVLFSSVAGLWGNAGQAGYAAANTFLDALAAARRAEGLPATSLAWGPWQLEAAQGGGMADALTDADWQRFARQGLAPHTATEGLALLDSALGLPHALLVPARLALRSVRGSLPALLSGLTSGQTTVSRTRRVAGAASAGGTGLAGRLASMSEADRDRTVLDLVRAQAALVLGMSGVEAVSPSAAFRDLGIDSLTAVELRNRLGSVTDLRLPAGVVFDYPTPTLLTGFLRARLIPEDVVASSARELVPTVARTEEDQLVIVGIGCRFPGGVGSSGEFWQLLADGVDTVSTFPADRGPTWDGVFEGESPHTRTGAFLHDAGDFDAQFFGISPREALAMDPQQRLLLETSWQALEDAGIDPGSLHGSATGVFAGLIYHDYAVGGVMPEEVQGYLTTGGSGGVASGRVAYALGLEGPAVTVDTACSSSLVALHLAAQALRSGECDLALAGGVTVMATPGTFLEFARQRGLSSDGRCKAYAQAADGTGWGEGVGMLVVERLSDARRKGHRVLAVLAGTAVNQDGASNGLTAPNGPSQQRVIQSALAAAGLSAADVDVVEGHGTGTRLGDPIEAEALIATYGQARDDRNPVLLGSVKSNIGHTQAAAGVAGVIKMIESMAHGTVPATLHVDEPSAHVEWDAGAVRLVTESTPWPDRQETGRPRRAAVSSFGFSGTNAHVILEQAPAEDTARRATVVPTADGSAESVVAMPVIPWTISARGRDSLAAQALRLREHLHGQPELDPLDVGWSLATARAHLPERAVLTGSSRDELLTRLDELIAGPAGEGAVGGDQIAFVFTGQGAQRAGMGQQLYQVYPVYARAFDEVCAALEEHLGGPGSLRDVLLAGEQIDQTQWAQAGLFALEVALFRLLESWGVQPSAVAGHSIGELAAAHVAGVWSLADAAVVVAARGRLMQALPSGGAMLSVRAGEDDVRLLTAGIDAQFDGLSIAAVNAPDAVVLSGPQEAVAAAEEHLSAQNLRVRRLRVSHAFHSALMEPMLAEFAAVTASVTYAAPRIPLVSTLTGLPAGPELLDPAYWVRQVREAVRFSDAVTALRDLGVRTFVEIGPDGVLSGLGAGFAAENEAWIPALRRDRDEPKTLVSALGAVHTRGGLVDWSVLFAGTGARRVTLPPYAFTRQRYWLEAGSGAADAVGLGQVGAAHPLLGASTTIAAGGVLLTGRLSLRSQPWLGEHVVAGQVVVPGAALVEMAVRAGDETGQTRVAELVVETPLILPPDNVMAGTRVQVTVEPADDNGRSALAIHSQPEGRTGAWTRHATGVLAVPDDVPAPARLTEWPPAGAAETDLDNFYADLATTGLSYGSLFQGVRRGWRRGDELFAEVALPEQAQLDGFALHPALLDASLHLLGTSGQPGEGPLLPFAWTDVMVHATGADTVRVRLAPAAEGFSVTLADENGDIVASVASLVLRALPADGLTGDKAGQDSLYEVSWVPVRAAAAVAERTWAVVGTDLPGSEAVQSYESLAQFEAALAHGAPAPDVVVVAAHPSARPDVAEVAHDTAAELLSRLQTWLSTEAFGESQLLILTDHALDAGPGAVPDPAASTVVGLVRVASAENPGRLVLADLDGTPEVFGLLQAGIDAGEPEFAVRQGELRVPRLTRPTQPLAVPSSENKNWRLDFTARGTLENLTLAPVETSNVLAPGQVRVGLRAAGVNFRDVLNVLGMYPGDAGQLGLEGAGVVLEVADGVTRLQPGDHVMGLFTAAFGPEVVTDERLLVAVPNGWSLTEAAAAPVVYLTAYYALVDLAGLGSGERILIHAAAGGVGIAAVQLARYLGAEVFGTASTPKWQTLRELGLPATHIASSRTLEFEDAFRAVTGGAGVDVVLDSLAGEFVDASARLAAGGRFVEMGKTDVRDPEVMAAAHDGLQYCSFDLLDTSPDRIAQMFAALSELFAAGVLTPLPVATWDVRRAPEAFRHLSQARNVGKVVLTIPAVTTAPGTVLITGASGALGGIVARDLARRGEAEALVLLSRRGPAAPGLPALAADLAELGADVQVVAADVADRAHLGNVLASTPDLRGVFHAAGVLDDGVLGAQTAQRLHAVLRPKADGAWHLHELTLDRDLRHFVLFSSIAGLWGNPGQANYAAANTFLDALAAHRRSRGLAAQSLAWGPWSAEGAGGMTSALAQADWERLSRSGTVPLANEEGLALLAAADAFARPALVPVHLDTVALEAQESIAPLLSSVVRRAARRKVGAPARAGGNALADLLAALPETEHEPALLEVVHTQTALVLGLPGADAIQAGDTFKDLGIDSLTALELRNRVNEVTGLRMPATLVFDYPTPTVLAAHLRAEIVGRASSVPAGPAVPAGARAAVAGDELVIVGIGCRFPGGAGSAQEFWNLLAEGQDAVGGFPVDRGPQWAGVVDHDPDAGGKSYAAEGGFLYDAGDFDARFFGINAREALAMDPQQRLLLETSWEALEDAGIDPSGLQGSDTGVFAGLIYHDYGVGGSTPDEVEGYLSTGTSGGVASGRVAYALGLEGPAVTVDTACSSSLVALHLAAQALRAGDCTLALAGGVTVMATPGTFVEFSRQRGLAADGRCKAYADAADGTGWGEGVGVLVLEKLSDARRNGHRILAVLRGSAMNQDGASNGLTAPNGPSQQRVIRAALASAGLGVADVDVVEGHGTGTRLGDPIEAQALLATYGQRSQERHGAAPLLLGSVKSNIGHTQAAAGVAGIIKMIQAMQHGIVPATLHVDAPSSHVDWETGAVQLVTEPTAWPATGRPRRAGISSFGFSGTNAHVIIEQAPPVPEPEVTRAPMPVVPWLVSGRGPAGLAAQAARLADALPEKLTPEHAVDLGWSLTTQRPDLTHRAVVLGRTPGELAEALRDLDGKAITGLAGTVGKTGFVFTGQGAQRLGMGQELYAAHPVFADAFDAVCAGLEEHLDQAGLTLKTVIGGEGSLDDTVWAQAGLFALEVALFRLLESWGVRPAVMAGHSIGELAAAHVAGVWSLADACAVVAARGRLMQALPSGGAMLAVALPESAVLERIADFDGIGVAAVNGPAAVVVSGAADQVEALAGELEKDEVRIRRLRVSHAFHSALMEPMLAEFAKVTRSVSYAVPRIPLVSTLTGEPVTGAVLEPGYWVRQVREAVRFDDAVNALRESGVRTFVELGPDGVLTGLGSQTEAEGELWVPTLRRDRDEAMTLLSALAHVHVRGGDVDWASVFAGTGAQRVALPTRAFVRQTYWLTPDTGRLDLGAKGFESSDHPLLGAALDLSNGGGVVMTGRLSLRTQPWLADHVVGGRVVVPGAALVEMAVRAGDEVGCTRIGELIVQAPLVLSEKDAARVQVTVGADGPDGARELTIHSRREDDPGAWTLHASGAVLTSPDQACLDQAPTDLSEWPPVDAEPYDLAGFYPDLADGGLAYGPRFQAVRAAWRRGEELFAEVELGDGLPVSGFALHPVLLDASLHLLGTTRHDESGPLLPFAWTDVDVHTAGAVTARVRLTPAGDEGVSVTLADESGDLVATVGSLVLRALPSGITVGSAQLAREALYELDWIPARADETTEHDTDGWVVLGGTLGLPGITRHPDLTALLADVSARPHTVIVPCIPEDEPTDVSVELPGAAREAVAAVLGTLQAWLAADELADSRLVLVTRLAVDAGAAPVDVTAAGVWGLARVAAAENPGRIVLVDLETQDNAIEALTGALATHEAQVAVRAGQPLMPRLVRAAVGLTVPTLDALDALNAQDVTEGGGASRSPAFAGVSAPAEGSGPSAVSWRLECTGRGTLENLALVPTRAGTRPLAPNEVRVALRAAGVNFRDVLNVLGMYPGEAGLLGLEGAGVVLEVGADVTALRPGDRVMGLFDGAFAPVAVTDSRLVVPVPEGWSLAEAAAAPVVYLTAWYALVVLAGLGEGERVLIHAAAGGVGIAAVQLARHLGADVFGTASPGKWPVLRALGLDETRIASSRTTGFEAAFRAQTGAAGIDVVLDSLAGEFVDASLRLAAGPGGRFVEMGKTDVRDPDEVLVEHDGLSYQAFDLLDCTPELIAEMFAALSGLFAAGVLKPLPVAAWDVRRTPEAFRHLSQARNVGKVVLTLPSFSRRSGTVLVTGASGALGGLVARHLAHQNSAQDDDLLLLSRRGPSAPGAALLAADLAETGVGVRVVAADAADRAGLASVLAAVPSQRPLSVVFHAAGVLQDTVIGSLTAESLEEVMRPKVDGAWNLHELTRHADLDRFVLFSSVAGTWGNPGQGNYAAANTVLDALAGHRRRAGLAATSLAWGPWDLDPALTGTTGGMAGTLTEGDRKRLARQGFVPLTAADGLALLDVAVDAVELEGQTPGAGRALLVAARLDRVALRNRDAAGLPPVAAGLVAGPVPAAAARRTSTTPISGDVPDVAGEKDVAAGLLTLGADERQKAIRDLVVAQAAHVLGLPGPEAVEVSRSFRELGFDSLTAVELRNRLGTATGLRLGAAVVFDHPTPDALTGHLHRQLGGEDSGENEVLAAFSGLEKVESALATLLADESARSRVTARVEELLTALRRNRAEDDQDSPEVSVADRIEAAEDDDIFDFIDKELGI